MFVLPPGSCDLCGQPPHAPVLYWRLPTQLTALSCRFTLRGLREPKPTDEAVRAQPDLEDATRVPYFVMFDLQVT